MKIRLHQTEDGLHSQSEPVAGVGTGALRLGHAAPLFPGENGQTG